MNELFINSKPLLKVVDSSEVNDLCQNLREDMLPVITELDSQVERIYVLQT